MENHPVDTELILDLSKAEGKESLFHWHQDSPAVGKRAENALCLCVAIHSQCQVSAAHRFSIGDVCCHQLGLANQNAGIQPSQGLDGSEFHARLQMAIARLA
jgi:hypothetical protein